jgi:serine/threonine-protein kinase
LRGIQAVRSFDHAAGAAPLLEAARRARAAGDETLIEVLDHLAIIELDRGDPGAALALEREALDERIRRHGAEDERTASAWNNLGYGLTGVGRYEEAAEAYRRTWEIDRLHRPTDSYDVLSSLSNWGWALTQAGQVREGTRRIADAEQGFQRLGGKPRYMHALNALKLCSLQHEFGDPKAAEPACARMLALSEEQAGNPSFLLGLAWRQEALRRMELGDLDGAAAALEDADAQFQDGQEYARGRFGVLQVGSFVWWLKGEAATARDVALEALEMRPPTQEVNLLRLRAILALACEAAPADRCGSPVHSLESAMRTVANPGHPRLLLPATALARLRLQTGDAGTAATLLDDAMQASAAELGHDHPQWRAAQLWRALALARQGDCADAHRLHREALDGAGDSRSPWLREARVAWLNRNACKGD